MYIIVIGMGQVGRHVVRTLEYEKHDVVAIDSASKALRFIEDRHDVATLQGYGASQAVLTAARAGEADLVVAVTDHDEVNLIAALAAKQMGAARVVARVQTNAWSGDDQAQGVAYGLLGVDVVFNPRVLLAQDFYKVAQSHGAIEVVDLANERIEVVKMELGEHVRVLHKTLSNLPLPSQVLVGAVVREGELFVPGGADVLLPGDRVYLVGLPDRMAQAEDLFSHRKQARRVCIIGGGVIGQSLSRQLVESGTEVLLIEQDEERAQHLASHLAGVTVVHGDGTDASLLEEEQIGDYDLLVALTHEDEVNLMAALLAGRAGAVRTGCLVHRPAYTEIYHQLGIDVVLSPRVVASDHIMRYCRQQQVQSLTVIEDGQAEVLELRAPERCRLIGVPVRRLAWPRGALLAAIVKGDSVMVPHGDDVVEAGDVVVVLTTTAARPAVLRLFKERAL